MTLLSNGLTWYLDCNDIHTCRSQRGQSTSRAPVKWDPSSASQCVSTQVCLLRVMTCTLHPPMGLWWPTSISDLRLMTTPLVLQAWQQTVSVVALLSLLSSLLISICPSPSSLVDFVASHASSDVTPSTCAHNTCPVSLNSTDETREGGAMTDRRTRIAIQTHFNHSDV
jgi:hypothetical protein